MYIDFLNVKVRLTCHKLRVEKCLHRLQTFHAFSVLLTPALVSLLILLNSSDGSASVRMVLDKTILVVACTNGIDKLLNNMATGSGQLPDARVVWLIRAGPRLALVEICRAVHVVSDYCIRVHSGRRSRPAACCQRCPPACMAPASDLAGRFIGRCTVY